MKTTLVPTGQLSFPVQYNKTVETLLKGIRDRGGILVSRSFVPTASLAGHVEEFYGHLSNDGMPKNFTVSDGFPVYRNGTVGLEQAWLTPEQGQVEITIFYPQNGWNPTSVAAALAEQGYRSLSMYETLSLIDAHPEIFVGKSAMPTPGHAPESFGAPNQLTIESIDSGLMIDQTMSDQPELNHEEGGQNYLFFGVKLAA